MHKVNIVSFLSRGQNTLPEKCLTKDGITSFVKMAFLCMWDTTNLHNDQEDHYMERILPNTQIRSAFIYKHKFAQTYRVMLVYLTLRQNAKGNWVTIPTRYKYRVNLRTNKICVAWGNKAHPLLEGYEDITNIALHRELMDIAKKASVLLP